jgi:hypothetical protein
MDDKLFKMDEILFKWIELDEFIHFILEPIVIGVFLV